MSTEPVTVTIAPLVPVHGRGRLRFIATATIEIAGVELVLQAVQVVADSVGRLTVRLPQTRHPRGADTLPAVILPAELHTALERAMLELVPCVRVIGTPHG